MDYLLKETGYSDCFLGRVLDGWGRCEGLTFHCIPFYTLNILYRIKLLFKIYLKISVCTERF